MSQDTNKPGADVTPPNPGATPPNAPAAVDSKPAQQPVPKPKPVKKTTDTFGNPISKEKLAAQEIEENQRRAMEEYLERNQRPITELTSSPIEGFEGSQWGDKPDGFRYMRVMCYELNPEGKKIPSRKEVQVQTKKGYEMVERDHPAWEGLDPDFYAVMRKPTLLSRQTFANALGQLTSKTDPIWDDKELTENNGREARGSVTERVVSFNDLANELPDFVSSNGIAVADIEKALQDQ
jgi:hypothetical protein